jgi:lipopolysaccharide biosynthesis protein
LSGDTGEELHAALDLQAQNQRRMAELKGSLFVRAAVAAQSLLRWLKGTLPRGGAQPTYTVTGGAGASVTPGPTWDVAAVVPFGSAFPAPSFQRPVGVVAHIYYPDLAALLRSYVERIPGPVDIYASTDTPSKREYILQAFDGWAAGTVEVRLAPNCGRDVAPKLIGFRDVFERYEIVLHLHGKRSPHDVSLRLWREYILETLAGDRPSVGSILAAFEQRPDLGLIAPQHYFAVRNSVDWGGNLAGAQVLAARMGFGLDPTARLDFPSGSMFWARSAALRPLLDLNLSTQDFEPEEGQIDGTLAHAIERLYFHACEQAGYRWLKIVRNELCPASVGVAAPIEDASDLAALLDAGPALRRIRRR